MRNNPAVRNFYVAVEADQDILLYEDEIKAEKVGDILDFVIEQLRNMDCEILNDEWICEDHELLWVFRNQIRYGEDNSVHKLTVFIEELSTGV